MADYLFFSTGAALDVYPSYNMTLAGLFWESLNYKMSVWDISLFFSWEAAGFWSTAQLLPLFFG